jgi:hypothetical protein
MIQNNTAQFPFLIETLRARHIEIFEQEWMENKIFAKLEIKQIYKHVCFSTK